MNIDEIDAAMSSALAGKGCRVIKREFDWVLVFDVDTSLVMTTPWRIVASGGIVFAGSDHGQKFGRPTVIDGALEASRLLEGRSAMSVTIRADTSDVSVRFDDGSVVEIFNHSSGYESWQARFRSEQGSQVIIGLGGGSIAQYCETSLP